MDGPDRTGRWRGALLGTALGDAVGAPFEGWPGVARDEVQRWLRADDPLTWTDDTAMTLGLARSLAACEGEVDLQHLGDTFAAHLRAEPWRGYGAGPPQIFRAAQRGTHYAEAAAAMFGGSGSFGNGAAMAGAMVGAHVGAHALPSHLLGRLEARDELQMLADHLAGLPTPDPDTAAPVRRAPRPSTCRPR